MKCKILKPWGIELTFKPLLKSNDSTYKMGIYYVDNKVDEKIRKE